MHPRDAVLCLLAVVGVLYLSGCFSNRQVPLTAAPPDGTALVRVEDRTVELYSIQVDGESLTGWERRGEDSVRITVPMPATQEVRELSPARTILRSAGVAAVGVVVVIATALDDVIQAAVGDN